MAFTLRKPIISIESKIDFKTLKTVKLQSAQQDGITTKKIEVPITDGGSFEGVLYTIREFNAVVTTLNYSTGDLLFTNFRERRMGQPHSTCEKDSWSVQWKH